MGKANLIGVSVKKAVSIIGMRKAKGKNKVYMFSLHFNLAIYSKSVQIIFFLHMLRYKKMFILVTGRRPGPV
jgi:FAD synthase